MKNLRRPRVRPFIGANESIDSLIEGDIINLSIGNSEIDKPGIPAVIICNNPMYVFVYQTTKELENPEFAILSTDKNSILFSGNVVIRSGFVEQYVRREYDKEGTPNGRFPGLPPGEWTKCLVTINQMYKLLSEHYRVESENLNKRR